MQPHTVCCPYTCACTKTHPALLPSPPSSSPGPAPPLRTPTYTPTRTLTPPSPPQHTPTYTPPPTLTGTRTLTSLSIARCFSSSPVCMVCRSLSAAASALRCSRRSLRVTVAWTAREAGVDERWRALGCLPLFTTRSSARARAISMRCMILRERERGNGLGGTRAGTVRVHHRCHGPIKHLPQPLRAQQPSATATTATIATVYHSPSRRLPQPTLQPFHPAPCPSLVAEGAVLPPLPHRLRDVALVLLR